MNRFFEKALWRSYSADDGGGPLGGGEVDFNGLAEAAYDQLEEPSEFDFDFDDAYDEAEDEEPGDDPFALNEEFVEAHPELAEAYGDQVSLLRSNVEAMAPMLALEHELADPYRAPEALRAFADAVARHHGYDLGSMLGFGGGSSSEPDWREMGFGSAEEYDDAPDWQRAGFDSPNEMRLARELDELRSLMAPTIHAQRQAQERAQQESIWHQFESAVRAEAPRAIAAIQAEHGWRVSPEQAIEAAARFPELAAQDLRSAILSAFPMELARHYSSGRRMPEMPLGGGNLGVRIPNPDTASIADLAEFAYSQI